MGSRSGSQIARRRLCAALVASLLTHAWFLAALPQVRQFRLGAALTIDARIQGLAPVFTAILGNPPVEPPVTQERDAPIREVRAAKAAATGNPKPGRSEERSTAALPQASDPTWYGAHELDTYPRALAPLQFDAGSSRAGSRLLLWLRIDEMGRIIDVTAGEGGVPAELLEAARASLAAVTFAPARKDERAVKSRIQVSLAY